MSEHTPLFSVIVPAYNSEKYIRKALDSIAEQTFTDYELIIVCDSCTDRTEEIAREYSDMVYIVNYGQDGQTRNAGLDHATGKWVLFLDDDDWYLHDFVFQMIADAISQDNLDILVFSYVQRKVGYHDVRHGMGVVCWNKCWRRSFIGDTRFSDAKRISDTHFHSAMMQKKARLALWSQPFVYYNWLRVGSQNQRWQNGEIE